MNAKENQIAIEDMNLSYNAFALFWRIVLLCGKNDVSYETDGNMANHLKLQMSTLREARKELSARGLVLDRPDIGEGGKIIGHTYELMHRPTKQDLESARKRYDRLYKGIEVRDHDGN